MPLPTPLTLCLLALMPVAAAAQTPDWTARKCALYADAWAQAVRIKGLDGIGQDFQDRHAAFLAQGCTRRGDVCPRSPQEYALADLLTLMAMSEGTAGSFLPFAC
jgi:hypothetical protein